MGKPTHPSDMTKAMLEIALNRAKRDRDNFNRAKAAGQPFKVMAFRAPDVSRRGIIVRDELEEAVQNVRKAQTRMIEQRLPVKAPKPKRVIERENVTKDGSVTRDIVKSPFTLPQTLRGQLEEMLQNLKVTGKFSTERRLLPEASQRPTRIDIALEAHEAQALSLYLEDRSLELSIGGQAPDSNREVNAIDRLAYVHKRLIWEDRDDLRIFTRMCVPIDDIEPMTTREFGNTISKSGAKDICEGAVIGAVRKIAQRLAFLHKDWKRDHDIRKKQTERKVINKFPLDNENRYCALA
jgi:hypothetical protein